MKTAFLAATAIVIAAAVPASAKPVSLSSPDGRITISVDTPEHGPPRYEVKRDGEVVLSPSPLGFGFTDGTRTDAMDMAELGRGSTDRTIPLAHTKTASARDHYSELVVSLKDRALSRKPMQLVVRAYDDAVALRYVVPGEELPFEIWNERTAFWVPTDVKCWGMNVGRTTTSHEGEFDAIRISQIHPNHMYDSPLLCKTEAGKTSFLITEADLDNYAGMYLRGREDGGLGVETTLALLPGNARGAVHRAAGEDVVTPWRVVMMADRAGDLIASTTLGNLNPQAGGDFSWVRPGKAAWDWWSGPYIPGKQPGRMNQQTLKTYIDFAGQSGLEYMLVDEGWALNSGAGGAAPKDTDITKAEPWLDMPELIAYAKARHVDLMLWLQWSQLDARMGEAMDQYVRWGIKGIKVDFMDRNDQHMVEFYHRILAEAARRHLLVDLHGAYPPTGLARTWPNFVTQEGVMGAEYNKWSKRVTASHNVNLVFTRMVLGPIDYTPGGFRNVVPADFRIVGIPPQVQTTRGQALAMYVVYESPLQMVADSPDAYAEAAEFAFIRQVPTTWDETRFLDGDVGSHVVVARRKGQDWYIGAMTNEQGRDVALPLSFLARGKYAATIWEDGTGPTHVVRTDRTFGPQDTVQLHLAPSGGAAIRLSPVRR